MSVVEIDIEGSLVASRTWARWGDSVSRSQLDVEVNLTRLQLAATDPRVGPLLASAATALWSASGLLRRVVELAREADGLSPLGLDVADLARIVRRAQAEALRTAPGCAPWSPGAGDLGGTECLEPRTPYAVSGSTALDRGRRLVVRALVDASAGFRIRPDEFELVELSDRRYLVVLPGVTDLSHPDLGLSDTNRTVRDLDQYAVRSWTSTSVADNRYAAMVWHAIRASGVPAGSQLVIIGHSFGADTALDLAADPRFNGGSGGYRVTHVIAAGYDSGPQLASVPASTAVLVLQNSGDAAVIAEASGHASLGGVIDRAGVIGAALGDAVFDLVRGDVGAAVDDATGAVELRPRVRRFGESQVVAVFAGGAAGAGHHPSNYIDYVAGAQAPEVTDFLERLGASDAIGPAYAVDVSVPG